MKSREWIGSWIEGIDGQISLPIFRKSFVLEDDLIKDAKLYICGLGQFSVLLNGNKITNEVLMPAWSNYDKTCYYVCLDLTNLLVEKKNIVTVTLGNGFYNVEGKKRYTKFKRTFGNLKLICDLEINYQTGNTQIISSDQTWETKEGPILFSSIYGGEDYDGRLDKENDSSWQAAYLTSAPKGKLVPQINPPLVVMKEYNATQITSIGNDRLLVDFGENFSGWVSLTMRGKIGKKLRIIPAELLKENGEPNQRYTGSPYEWNYTFGADATKTWAPQFSYYGFRYVLLEGATSNEENNDAIYIKKITGQMIYPEMPIVGEFTCSNVLINQIHQIINQAILSNMKSILTDCPHREKLGWLEQDHLMGPAILYNYPMDSLFSKVLCDIRDSQREEGMIPTTAPEYVVFKNDLEIFRHSVSWAASYILIPYMLYQRTGEKTVFAEHYAYMKKYINYLIENSINLIIQDGLGDWYDIGPQGPGLPQNTPISLVETALFFEITSVLSKIANLLSKQEDALYYEKVALQIKKKFNEQFFNVAQGFYGTNSQTANAMALALKLCPENERLAVLKNLVMDIKKHHFHTTVGDIGFRYVLLTLMENNHSDIIYQMSQQTDNPSYGYQVLHGATTLTEAWDGPTIGKSQNHFMLGHIEEWFYKGLAGINYEYNAYTGSYKIEINPYLDNDLSFVKGTTYLTSDKLISIHWYKKANQLLMNIMTPLNSEVKLKVPSEYTKQLSINDKLVGQNTNEILLDDKVEIQLPSGKCRFIGEK